MFIPIWALIVIAFFVFALLADLEEKEGKPKPPSHEDDPTFY